MPVGWFSKTGVRVHFPEKSTLTPVSVFHAAPRSRQSPCWLGSCQRPLLLAKHSSVIADPVQVHVVRDTESRAQGHLSPAGSGCGSVLPMSLLRLWVSVRQRHLVRRRNLV